MEYLTQIISFGAVFAVGAATILLQECNNWKKFGQSKIPDSIRPVTLYHDFNGTLLIRKFKSFNQFVAQFPPITFLGYSSSLRGRRTFCSCRTTLGFFCKRQVLCCHPLHLIHPFDHEDCLFVIDLVG